MMAFAPPRLSTTSGWPSTLSISFAMALALASVAPPGGNGTIRRIGRVGHACCAAASAAITAAEAASAAIAHRNEYRAFIVLPPTGTGDWGLGTGLVPGRWSLVP